MTEWRKSSRSNTSGSQCVEVATLSSDERATENSP
jgi:hypothetical protein